MYIRFRFVSHKYIQLCCSHYAEIANIVFIHTTHTLCPTISEKTPSLQRNITCHSPPRATLQSHLPNLPKYRGKTSYYPQHNLNPQLYKNTTQKPKIYKSITPQSNTGHGKPPAAPQSKSYGHHHNPPFPFAAHLPYQLYLDNHHICTLNNPNAKSKTHLPPHLTLRYALVMRWLCVVVVGMCDS